MRTLSGADGGHPPGDLGASGPPAFREKTPGLLLDRDAAQTRLQSQARRRLAVQIADDDRGHRGR
jgi:hypothetical protein